MFHCKHNLNKESILKADAIFSGEGRENEGNGLPTPNKQYLKRILLKNKSIYRV